jgi:hypothetical protein
LRSWPEAVRYLIRNHYHSEPAASVLPPIRPEPDRKASIAKARALLEHPPEAGPETLDDGVSFDVDDEEDVEDEECATAAPPPPPPPPRPAPPMPVQGTLTRGFANPKTGKKR